MENAQASSFESLLGESRDLVSERLRAAVARMLEKADEALATLTVQTQNKETQQAYQQTRKLLVSGRQTLATQFHQLYLAEFLKRTSQVADDGQSFAEFDTSLELVGRGAQSVRSRDDLRRLPAGVPRAPGRDTGARGAAQALR